MKMKAYHLVGIDTALHLLRPGAKWEFTGGIGFTRWDDPRPCPSVEEVFDVIEKLKEFEDSINIVLLPEQQEKMQAHLNQVQKELDVHQEANA